MIVRRIVAASVCAAAGLLGMAQDKQLTAADYARAEKFMAYNVNPLVFHTVNAVTWIGGDRFWFRDTGPDGVTYTLVDAAKHTQAPMFDHAKMASALTAAGKPGTPLDPHHLDLSTIVYGETPNIVTVTLRAGQFRCDLSGAGSCAPIGQAPVSRGRARAATDVSPDGKRAAFIRDWNLWVRDLSTGAETQLTTDGVKDYGYATDNAGWTQSDAPILVWSPDSKKIATFQQDQRKTGEMYLVSTTNGHPTLKAWKYPLVGDKDVTMIERVIIELDGAKLVRLKMPPDQHRSTLCDDVSCRGGSGWDDVQWSEDGKHLAFVSTSRDHKQEWMRVANREDRRGARGDDRDGRPNFSRAAHDKVNWHLLCGSQTSCSGTPSATTGAISILYDLAYRQTEEARLHKASGNVTQVLGIDDPSGADAFTSCAVGK